MIISGPNLQLPWTSTQEDDRRYWKVFFILLVPTLILSIVIPWIDLPEPTREDLEKLPPQLARVVLEEQKLPEPPPPPKPKPKAKKPKPKPKAKKPKKPKPKPKKPKPKPKQEPVQLVDKARKAAEAEINQFADALSDMRDSIDLSDVSSNNLTRSSGRAAKVDRAIIGKRATGGSGGINTSRLSRNTGGVALSGKRNTRVSSKLAKTTGKGDTGSSGGRNSSGRSSEEIRKIMDQNKAGIYSLYNRALRKNPSLEGKVMFKIVIDPSGKVVDVKIVSSDLNDPALEKRLLSRIRLINFGAKNVSRTTVNYAFDFLPS